MPDEIQAAPIIGRKNTPYPITADPPVPIRMIRGRIVPCDGCKRKYYCEMYKSFTRMRMRGQYAHGTNILHHCSIYVPDKIPGNIRAPRSYDHGQGFGMV